MPVENAQYLNQLDATLPSPTDPKSEGDDHIREIKRVVKATFPNVSGPVSATADQLSYPVPIGGIIMWSGSTTAVPTGWALCNGQVVTRSDGAGSLTTPDLRDRFVIGAGNIATGTTGGSASISATTNSAGDHTHSGSTDVQGRHGHGGSAGAVSLTIEQLPPHNHGYGALVPTGGAGNGLYFPSNLGVVASAQATESTGSGAPHLHPISSDGDHAHGVSISSAGGHTHAVTIADTRPPFYALAMIIRV